MTPEEMPDDTLTGDHIAGQLYSVQGFLIIGSRGPREIGDVVNNVATGFNKEAPQIATPLRIAAVSSLAEFEAQWKLLEGLQLIPEKWRPRAGDSPVPIPSVDQLIDHLRRDPSLHFYRVESD